jgi:cellulose synthase (UDP-forming)
VQTIKQAQVSAGDPFNNWEPMFYRGQMLARNAANAVFPCGSGLVWRRSALREIGEFPTWNLVEDVQSGLEALRLG